VGHNVGQDYSDVAVAVVEALPVGTIEGAAWMMTWRVEVAARALAVGDDVGDGVGYATIFLLMPRCFSIAAMRSSA
jgi:hypothetical protein